MHDSWYIAPKYHMGSEFVMSSPSGLGSCHSSARCSLDKSSRLSTERFNTSARIDFSAAPTNRYSYNRVVVTRKRLHIREGYLMSSNDAGDLPRGTQVVLLETREDPSGMPRARVAFPPLGLPIQTAVMQGMVASIGWVSWLGRDGEANLLAVDDPAAAVAIESSAKAKARTAAKRAAAKAASVLADNQVPLQKPLTQHEMFAFATAAGQRALGINSESSSIQKSSRVRFSPAAPATLPASWRPQQNHRPLHQRQRPASTRRAAKKVHTTKAEPLQPVMLPPPGAAAGSGAASSTPPKSVRPVSSAKKLPRPIPKQVAQFPAEEAMKVLQEYGSKDAKLAHSALLRLVSLYVEPAAGGVSDVTALVDLSILTMIQHVGVSGVQTEACNLLFVMADSGSGHAQRIRAHANEQTRIFAAAAAALREHPTARDLLQAVALMTLQLTKGSAQITQVEDATYLAELLRWGAVRVEDEPPLAAQLEAASKWLSIRTGSPTPRTEPSSPAQNHARQQIEHMFGLPSLASRTAAETQLPPEPEAERITDAPGGFLQCLWAMLVDGRHKDQHVRGASHLDDRAAYRFMV